MVILRLLINQNYISITECQRIDQLKVERLLNFLKQRRSGPQNHRVDNQPVFVNQVVICLEQN